MFEILTLRQTGKFQTIPVLLFDRDYWQSVVNFKALLDADMIDGEDLESFGFADTAEELWQMLQADVMNPRRPIG
jgi:predicted Rossmann-fold nucleotide-binding protein